MNNRLLLPFLLITLNACSNTSPFIGIWSPENSTEEWLISRKSSDNTLNLAVIGSGVQVAVFPLEVTDKTFSFNINLGIGTNQYNCSSTGNKNELNCNLKINTLYDTQTKSFKLVRQPRNSNK